MTDLALTVPPSADAADAPPRKRGRRLLALALPLVLGGAGFASSWLGYWSPLALAGFGAPAEAPGQEAGPAPVFVDVPAIDVTLPDAEPRMLHLVLKLETTEGAREAVEHLLPRVSDAFTTFLTGIAPQAFERRGILEVVRDELDTRATLALGPELPVDVLISEFVLK